jgi:prevent-host-death family protein
MKTKERTIPISEFRAKCLKILDHLGPSGIIVTKRGRPIARVTPLPKKTGKDFYGCMAGKITVKGDIFSTGRKWDAQSKRPHLDLAYHR